MKVAHLSTVLMLILVAVGRKLLSVFYAILKTGIPYDPNCEENRHLAPSPCLYMAVNTLIAGIEPPSDKSPRIGWGPIENAVPGLIPVEFPRLLGPEFLRVIQ